MRSEDLDDSFVVMIRTAVQSIISSAYSLAGKALLSLERDGLRPERRKAWKLHGIAFDIVYTWLSRAIETAWLVLDELDCLWLPIVKTWRLMNAYALTGLSKMIAQKHGQSQF